MATQVVLLRAVNVGGRNPVPMAAFRRLDVVRDDLGGPYDAVYAAAVFLHLSRTELAAVLDRTAAVAPLLAFTVKVGDGGAWTEAKLDRPRHFTYWRADALAAVIDRSPWTTCRLDEVAGDREDWLFAVCTRAAVGA